MCQNLSMKWALNHPTVTCCEHPYLGDISVLAHLNEAFVMLISVFATEMTDNRCCVVIAVEICQWPLTADITAISWSFPLMAVICLYHPGSSKDMCPPRDNSPNDIGRFGRSKPNLLMPSLSRSGSSPQACIQDMNNWAMSIT